MVISYRYFSRCSLLAICDIPNRNDLIKLIISSLDYGHDVYSRIILSKVLTASDQVWSSDNIIMGSCDLLQAMRLYATKHLRVLLRAKMQFFNNWGIQMLVTQVTCDIIMCYVSCDLASCMMSMRRLPWKQWTSLMRLVKRRCDCDHVWVWSSGFSSIVLSNSIDHSSASIVTSC